MSSTAPEPRGWLSEYSEPAIRAALESAAPDLRGLPITLGDAPDLSKPLWASAHVTVGRDIFVKLAFSGPTAIRICQEAHALRVLRNELGLQVPKLIASGQNPTFSSTELITGGEPLTYETVAVATPDHMAQVAHQLARFLSQLHAPQTLSLIRARIDTLPRLPEPGLHVSSHALRARFPPMIEPHQRPTVSRWLDWIDDQLAQPSESVFVHGDLHPYNQLWDLHVPRLISVMDFETSGVSAPEFDFRVLPVFGPGIDLLVSTVERYQTLTGRVLSLPRIMALHLLNYLGDALWRTEAGIALPKPGDSPSAYVQEAAGRLAALDINP